MGTVSNTRLSRVGGRTLSQPQARAVCQAEMNFNEDSCPTSAEASAVLTDRTTRPGMGAAGRGT